MGGGPLITPRLELDELVEGLITNALATAVAVEISRHGEVLLHREAGERIPGEVLPTGALFDLASLTKIVTATLALSLDQGGHLSLSTSIGAIWPRAGAAIRDRTLGDLLRHRAGFKRWMPLYEICESAEQLIEYLLNDTWTSEVAGPDYSDLDVMLWGLSVERASGTTYRRLVEEHLLDVLGDRQLTFGWEADDRTVACDLTTLREVELAAEQDLRIDEMGPPELGEPQDGNTRFLRRVIGHAGLFGELTVLSRLAREWLYPGDLLRPDSVARALGGPGRFALGWFRQSETQGGRALGPQAFGHEGFTGGSLWSDPATDLTVAVVAHRASVASDLGPFREALHHLAQRL